MSDDAKNEVATVLGLLRSTLIRNSLSMGMDGKGDLLFFDTDTYIKTGKMDGFSVDINTLVK